MKQFLIISVILAAMLLSACGSSETTPTPTPTPTITSTFTPAPTPTITSITTPTPDTPKQWSTPPAMQIDTTKTYFATVDTSLGTFKIQLFADETPKTVNNFVFLAEQGFYNGVIFHRVIKTFMIQTGDLTGTGTGSPGYQFDDELPPKRYYIPGIVAMANAGANTQGSQFFICTGDDAHNLGSRPLYTQFGQIVEGMDVVQKIAAVEVGPGNPGENSRPINPPVINKITITQQSTTPPTPTTLEPPECEADRVAIQAALDAYNAANGKWPTADGNPGMIEWDKLVPDFLAMRPTTVVCKWQVNTDPEGQVCRSAHC